MDTHRGKQFLLRCWPHWLGASRSKTISLSCQPLNLHNILIFAIFILHSPPLFLFCTHLQSWVCVVQKTRRETILATNSVALTDLCSSGCSHKELRSMPTLWAPRYEHAGKGRITETTKATAQLTDSCHRDRSASQGILILNMHRNSFLTCLLAGICPRNSFINCWGQKENNLSAGLL